MKILMLGRTGLLDNIGGDRIQIEQSALHLRNLGFEVDVKTGRSFDPSSYDIVHIFQLDWNLDCYFQANIVKKYGKPLVLSPIHHNLQEVKRFDDEYVFDFRRFSKILFRDQFHRDLFKEFYRAIFNPSRLYPVLFAMLCGLKKMYIRTLQLSDVVLVQTDKEAEDLHSTFNVALQCVKVSNGVGESFLKTDSFDKQTSFEDYILCVGRIEPRKNQLNIIKALKKLRKETSKDIQVIFIGTGSKSKHFEYNKIFETYVSLNKWIHHITKVPYDKMPSYYHFAKVGVSASWFETTGLTSIEALFCGTNAVAAGDRAKEYLKDYASYCDPGDIDSIKDAILIEMDKKRPVLDDKTKSEYTWENTAKKLSEVYNSLI